MDKKKTQLLLTLAALAAVIVSAVAVFSYYREKTVIASGDKEASIYIEPDIPATRAAAGYLTRALERTLGKTARIVTEKQADGSYISIVCGPEPDDIEKEPPYSIFLEKTGVVIHMPKDSQCFGVVRAVADRWLQEDSGLRADGRLTISRAKISRQLSGLNTAVTGQIRILTQNLRCLDDEDGNSVEERAERFLRLLEDYQPDLIGTQECTLEWLQLLQEALSDRYAFYGCSRLGPEAEDGEWNAVLYGKDRFSLLNGGTFWLSNTPGVATSKLNYDGHIRICTWTLLQDAETANTILFSNTHLQQGGGETYQKVRAKQAETLFWQLRDGNMLFDNPGFLTGDFNGTSDEEYYSGITAWYVDSAQDAIKNSSSVDYSYHGYGRTQALVDFCFHSPGNVTVLDYRILDDWYDGYVSDHYGVLVTAVLD